MAKATAAVEATGGLSDHGHPETNTGISNNKLTMWLFLSSDCLLCVLQRQSSNDKNRVAVMTTV